MNEHKPPTPESVWRSIDGKEEAGMEITFTPDQLCAMAHSREQHSIWLRRILLAVLIGLAIAFTYNVLSVGRLWATISLGWMLVWICLLIWRFRRAPRPMSAAGNCAAFLRHEFENKRAGLLEFRRYMFLLIPPILVSWWADDVRALRLIRMRAMGVDPSSRLYAFASGPWLFVVIALLLTLVWFAFGIAAKKAAREMDELHRRTRE